MYEAPSWSLEPQSLPDVGQNLQINLCNLLYLAFLCNFRYFRFRAFISLFLGAFYSF